MDMELEQKQEELINHFVQQASSLSGSDLASLVVEATSHPSLFAFSKILSVPSILQLEGTDDSVYLDVLRLFAEGTLSDYKRNAGRLPELVHDQELKLKQLTMLTLAETNKELPYDQLMQQLEVANVPELEEFLIHKCMHVGIVRGEVDTLRNRFGVQFAAVRNPRPEQHGSMIQELSKWSDTSESLPISIEEKIDWADKICKLNKQHRMEDEDEEIKRSLKDRAYWAHAQSRPWLISSLEMDGKVAEEPKKNKKKKANKKKSKSKIKDGMDQANMDAIMRNLELTETRMMQAVRDAESRAEEERTAHNATKMAAREREVELKHRALEASKALAGTQRIADERTAKASELEQKMALLEVECANLNQELQDMRKPNSDAHAFDEFEKPLGVQLRDIQERMTKIEKAVEQKLRDIQERMTKIEKAVEQKLNSDAHAVQCASSSASSKIQTQTIDAQVELNPIESSNKTSGSSIPLSGEADVHQIMQDWMNQLITLVRGFAGTLEPSTHPTHEFMRSVMNKLIKRFEVIADMFKYPTVPITPVKPSEILRAVSSSENKDTVDHDTAYSSYVHRMELLQGKPKLLEGDARILHMLCNSDVGNPEVEGKALGYARCAVSSSENKDTVDHDTAYSSYVHRMELLQANQTV